MNNSLWFQALTLKITMNSSVDPCDDFYEYACGGWDNGWINTRKKSPKHYIMSEFNDILFHYNFHVNKEDYNHSRAFNQAKTFFNSCTKSGSDLKAVYNLLKNVDLPKIPYVISKLERGQSAMEKILAKCQLLLGTSFLFEVDILPDLRDDTRNIVTLLESSTKQSLSKKNIIDTLSSVISDVYHNKTDDNFSTNITERLQDAASIIYNLNQELMDIDVRLRTYAPSVLSIRELSIVFKSKNIMQPKSSFLWTAFMLELLENFHSIILEDEVAISNVHTFFNLDALLTKTSPEDLELFIWWKIMEMLHPQVARNLGNNTSRIQSHCREATFSNFDFVSLRLLSGSEQLHKKYAEIDQMERDIGKKFALSVSKSHWLDGGHKLNIFNGIKDIKYFIGPPKWIFNDTKLDEYYAQIFMTEENFLENILRMKHHETSKKFQSHFSGHLVYESRMQRQINFYSVNAFFKVLYRQVEIDNTLLLYPFYNDLKFSNYGILGFYLGHELTHAFDSTRIGRYLSDGSFDNNIASIREDSQKNFYEKTKCFIDQYKNYDLKEPGLSVNARLSLDEIIADNVGIRLAFEAYQEWKDANGEEKSLPLFSTFSSEQLFFLEYAQVHCKTYTREELVAQLKVVHPPDFVRVNNALRNSEDFSRAWSCPAASKMNPLKKCRIW